MTTSNGPQKRLPENPSEENFRKQAKRLARQEGLQLATAQRHLAHDYGYRNWAELMEAMKPRLIPILPLRGLVAFPHETYPIYIGRATSLRAIESIDVGKDRIFLVTQKDGVVAAPSPADMYEVGTVGLMVECVRLPDGTAKALVEGKHRARATRYLFDKDFYKAEVEAIEEPGVRAATYKAIVESVRTAFDAYARVWKIKAEIAESTGLISDPAILSDLIVGHLRIDLEPKQKLLECFDPGERLQQILKYLEAVR